MNCSLLVSKSFMHVCGVWRLKVMCTKGVTTNGRLRKINGVVVFAYKNMRTRHA